MKITETLSETQQKVLDAIVKLNDSSAETIAEETKINKMVVFKAVKFLTEKGLIEINNENDPITYKALEGEVKGKVPVKKATKTEAIEKEKDDQLELKLGGRNTTKFKFNGEEYGKSRLVLAIVKAYVLENQKVTFTKLKEVFPDELQPRYGMFEEVSKAKATSTDRERYFLKSEELIKLGDKKVIAVCSQFDINNLPLKHFKSLGFKIK